MASKALKDRLNRVGSGTSEGNQSNAALGTARSATEGMTFGWGDEAGIGIAAGMAALQDPDKTFGEVYDQMREQYAYRQGQFEEEHPVLSTGAEVAGGLASGVAGASRLAGSKGLQAIPAYLRYPGAGAVSGGVAGAGFSDEGSRTEGAVTGAGVGGVAGAALPAIGAAARPLARRVMGKVRPQNVAARRISQALDDDEMDLAALRRRLSRLGGEELEESGLSPVNIADAGGYNVLGTARAAQSIPGKGKNAIRTALEARDKGQLGRIARKLDETINADGSFRGTADELEAQLRVKARPFYQKAYRENVSTETLDDLMSDPILESAYRRMINKPHVQRDLAGYTPKSIKALDTLKKELDDAYESAVRQESKNNKGWQILQAKQSLTKAADEASPDYAKARAVYGGDAQKREAMDLGKRVLMDPEDVSEDVIKNLSEGDRAFFRLGAKQGIMEKMEQAGYTHDVTKRIFNSPKLRKRLAQAFPDSKSFRQFQREMLREQRKRLTKDQVLGGSPTQRIKAEQASVTGSEAAEAASAAARGDTIGLASRVMQGVFSPDTAPNPKVAEQISRMLMTRNPADQKAAMDLIRRSQMGLLSDAPPALGTGVGAIGVPAASGGLLSR